MAEINTELSGRRKRDEADDVLGVNILVSIVQSRPLLTILFIHLAVREDPLK